MKSFSTALVAFWVPVPTGTYDCKCNNFLPAQVIEIDLNTLEPHVNGPFTPDLATPISKLGATAKQAGWPLEVPYNIPVLGIRIRLDPDLFLGSEIICSGSREKWKNSWSIKFVIFFALIKQKKYCGMFISSVGGCLFFWFIKINLKN